METPRTGRLLRLAEGLDSLLSNFVGSAQIGPYVPPDPEQRRIDIAVPELRPAHLRARDRPHRRYRPALLPARLSTRASHGPSTGP